MTPGGILVLVLLGLVGLAVATETTTGFLLGSDRSSRLARAIGKAEGYGVAGAFPTRNNNPGDITVNGVKAVFGSIEEGAAALVRQIRLIGTGKSRVYNSSDTFRTLARKWTGGDNADSWASIVSAELGVSPDTNVVQWLNGSNA